MNCKHGLTEGTCSYCSGLVKTPSLAGISPRSYLVSEQALNQFANRGSFRRDSAQRQCTQPHFIPAFGELFSPNHKSAEKSVKKRKGVEV